MARKILITAALPYANGPLHFGHIAGAYLPADCYARFQRLLGNDALFICGSDEHGVAITLSAEMAGRSPKEHVDYFHEVNAGFFQKLGISFDHYSRTTWPGHIPTTQQYFRDLLANGYIEEKVTEQLYSEKEKKFLADRYVVGTCPKCGYEEARGDECQKCGASYEATDLKNPRSKLTGAPLTAKPTNHWFLRFDKFKDQLRDWLATRKWKANVVNFAKSYVDDLKPRAITRDSDWGIPVPLDEAKGKIFYVWFDAPIGYISATQDWAQKVKRPDAWKDYWLDPDTFYVQFIGKDNIPFHAVFFPAMTMGQDQPYKLVDELPANEFYNLEGRQFSKSEGWTIDLDRFFQRFTVDQIRYTIAANAPESQDAEFTWRDFEMRCNSELVGKYGNFANRTLVFAANHCSGHIPKQGNLQEIDRKFQETLDSLAKQIAASYEGFHVRKATQLIMELAQAGNVYFDAKKPWALVKDPNTRPEMETTIALCIEALKLLALVSSPIIPTTAQKLWNLLGLTTVLEKQNWKAVCSGQIPAGTVLPPPQLLLHKVDEAWIQEEIDILAALPVKKPKEPEPAPRKPLKPPITFDDFSKVDLRIGKIVHAEAVAKSKKLLKLTVDIGLETRTIVSGIRGSYEDPAALIGQNIVLVANLQPATLMGIESQGMVLATDTVHGLKLLTLESSHPGDTVA